MINKINAEGGVTNIHNGDGERLGSFELEHAFDAMFLDDRRVTHGVTPINRTSCQDPSYRDVLVLTFDELGPFPVA